MIGVEGGCQHPPPAGGPSDTAGRRRACWKVKRVPVIKGVYIYIYIQVCIYRVNENDRY